MMGLVFVGLVIWAALHASGGGEIPPGLLASLGSVALALTLILFAFDQWVWRWQGIRRLVPRPVLVGTWAGMLHSDWKDAEGNGIDPIGVFLVVHQTFWDVQVRLLTPESHSVSLSSAVNREPDGRYTVLVVYRNEPELKHQERSPIHFGGMQLRLEGSEGERLAGDYWTSRKTTGSLTVRKISETRAADYASALALRGQRGEGTETA